MVVVETRHVADSGEQENVRLTDSPLSSTPSTNSDCFLLQALNLDAKQLKYRKVEQLDIAQDPNDHSNEVLADPRTFVSTKRERGPLGPDWIVRHAFTSWLFYSKTVLTITTVPQKTTKPLICAYKYVHVDFQFRAFRNRVETLILDVRFNLFASMLST